MKTWKEVSPYSGQDIEEDAPANSVAGGGVSMPPDALQDKKKRKPLIDGRTKAYRAHREKLETARVKRAESRRRSSIIGEQLDKIKNLNLEYAGSGYDKVAPMGALNSSKNYDLYHKDFSSAMQHAYKMAKKLHGITIDPKEIDSKVATGPKKPGNGKTNKYSLKGDKGTVQIQVYNKGGSKPFELNMYKS